MSDNAEVALSDKTKLELELERSERGGGGGRGGNGVSFSAGVVLVLVLALLTLLVYEHMRLSGLEKTVGELSSKIETLQSAGVTGTDESKKSQDVENSKPQTSNSQDEDKTSSKAKSKAKTHKTAREKK